MKSWLLSYWRMFKSGPAPTARLFSGLLFDLRHGTETHIWLPKADYRDQPPNFEHGTFYMASWTSVIRAATEQAIAQLRPRWMARAGRYCEGKVLCTWSLTCGRGQSA